MEGIATVIFLLSVMAVLPAFLMSMYCSYVFEQHLKEEHPEVWREIAPDPAAEPSFSSPSSRFVTQRKYRTLNDETLNTLGDRCYIAVHVAVSVFMVFIFSVLFSSLT